MKTTKPYFMFGATVLAASFLPVETAQAAPGNSGNAPIQLGGAPQTPDQSRMSPEMRRERREAMLAQADTDGDGTLSEAERQAAALQRHEQAKQNPRYPKLVERFDADGDGALSDQEWLAAHESMRENRRSRMEERQAGRLEEFDSNSDGQLSPEERQAARQARVAANPRLAELRKLHDVDGDGVLSPTEKAAAKAELSATRDEKRQKGLMRAFDLNRDGELDAAEREAAHELVNSL